MTAVDTFACRLTPAGRGAIATVLVWGPTAVACVARQFRSRTGVALATTQSGRILFGTWSSSDQESSAESEVGEEVVVCRTGEDRVEIHCHGGQAAARAILDALQSRGCRIVDWMQLPSHDRIQRDVLLALASARTDTVAAILIDQQRGALGQALDQLDRALAADDLANAQDRLAQLMQHQRLGCRLTSPWRVAIVGPPNVGKSSLINAIVGFQRAIVFDSPGTTRDVVTASTAIRGWPVDFADTAGIRTTDDTVEAAGVERSFEQLKHSDLIIVLLDARSPVAEDIQALLDDFPEALVVQNKIDLVEQPVELPFTAQATSATHGDGISELLSSISERLIGQPPPPRTPMPFTPQQFDELRAVQAAMEHNDAQLARQRLCRFRSGQPD